VAKMFNEEFKQNVKIINCNFCRHYGNCNYCSDCKDDSKYEFDFLFFSKKRQDELKLIDEIKACLTGEIEVAHYELTKKETCKTDLSSIADEDLVMEIIKRGYAICEIGKK